MSELSDIEKRYIAWYEATRQFEQSKEKRIPPIFKKVISKKIALPKNFTSSGLSIEAAIEQRVSRRSFGPTSLTDVSKLLYYANGFRKLVDGGEYGIAYQSNAPSAGSKHSIEIYLIARTVEGLCDGVYHYDVENHELETISEQAIPSLKIKKLLGGQKLFDAPLIVCLSSVHKRTSWKYGPRGYRFIHLDAGHIGQNIYLIGESMKLAVCGIGRWDDEIANKLLAIDGQREFLVYMIAIGKRVE